jgi:hypothetical protein
VISALIGLHTIARTLESNSFVVVPGVMQIFV